MVLSFILFLGLFVLIGVSAVFKSRSDNADYYLASQSISPLLVGLSAVATNNSGYMFIGVIGYTYATGLASVWLMVGWIAGDYLASIWVHKRLRAAAQRTGAVTYAGVLGNWTGTRQAGLQRLIGAISLLFLLAYASAQLVAGSKALHVLFDWPLWSGAMLGAVLISIYCFSGGIRASIWTDVAQSLVMIVAMAVLLWVATDALGGTRASIRQMQQIDGFMDWFPKDLVFPGVAGGILFAASWAFAGLSVIGQPHIMVRFMALNNVGKMRQARAAYYIWFSAFYGMAVLVGMLARVHLNDTSSFDAELALPTMALHLLPPTLVGLILAGIFAATMSTADSLILSCSATITHDLMPARVENIWLLKLSTLAVTLCALVWSLSNKQSVFDMVIMAWSGLASAFAPLLLMLCLGMKPGEKLSIAAILCGFLAAGLWRYLGLNHAVYEGMIGILVGVVILGGGWIYTMTVPRVASQNAG